MSSFKNVPSEFICPLSLQVMIQPLISKTGIHFERSAILAWLAQGSNTCPITHKALKASDLVPDKRLEARLQFWREEHKIVVSSVVAEQQQQASAFVGFCALGERPISAPLPKKKSFFPRVFRSSRVSAITA
jgi:hypothetical protein